MLHEAFYKVHAEEDIWKMLLEEFQTGCLVLGNL